MSVDAMYNLRDSLCKELEPLTSKSQLSAGDLDVIDKLTHSIKSLETIIAMYESGYSGDTYARIRRDGHSYARKRDNMGRYSRTGYRYSRDDFKEEVLDCIREMMENTDGRQREILRKAAEELRDAI